MSRTRVAAPQIQAEAGELTQQHDVELTRQGIHQEASETIPVFNPRDIETAAFFEQPVQIMVHEKPDTPIPGVMLNVNGEDCAIPFGRPIVVKRKFVQQLLDMRETNFTQPKRDQFNVEAGNRLIPKTNLLFPFAVSADPHRGGMEWLQREQMRAARFTQNLR